VLFRSINECASNPCQNLGTCNDHVNGFNCTCPSGYTGLTCNNITNNCASNPCLNNATCVNGVNRYTCTCAPGYTGFSNCSTVIDMCASNPCYTTYAAGSTPPATGTGAINCTSLVNAFRCNCYPGFTGVDCSTIINNCASNPCLNGGTCVNLAGNFTCTCPSYNGVALFSGSTCGTALDLCTVANPCLNGATCSGTNATNVKCACAAGYFGATCATFSAVCSPNPCLNGGSCSPQSNNINYTCTCPASYTGSTCNQLVNFCSANPCGAGGVCTSNYITNTYSCACYSGYDGVNCAQYYKCTALGTFADPKFCYKMIFCTTVNGVLTSVTTANTNCAKISTYQLVYNSVTGQCIFPTLYTNTLGCAMS